MEFFSHVLSWDLFHLPSLDAATASVPASFDSAEHYVAAFTPLLLEETCASLRQEMDRGGLRAHTAIRPWGVAKGYEATVTLGVRPSGPVAADLRDGDVVLVSPDADCVSARGSRHALAVVSDRCCRLMVSRARFEAQLKSPLEAATTAAAIVSGRAAPAKAGREAALDAAQNWHVWRVANLVTSLREFVALRVAPMLRLSAALLRGHCERDGGRVRSLEFLGPEFAARLQGSYNPSQLAAIEAACTNVGFTLVQGPPGTGKTRTLVGLLNTLHMAGFHRHYDSVLSRLCAAGERAEAKHRETGDWGLAREEVAAALRASHAVADGPDRVLVVAPSNGAVNEIARRIMKHGFVDGRGQRYNPNILRVGKAPDSLHPISVQAWVDAYMRHPIPASERLPAAEAALARAKAAVAAAERQVLEAVVACAQQGESVRRARTDAPEESGCSSDVSSTQNAPGSPPESPIASADAPTLRRVAASGHGLGPASPTQLAFEHAATTLMRAREARLQVRQDVETLRCAAANDEAAVRRGVLRTAHIVLTTLSSSALRELEEGARGGTRDVGAAALRVQGAARFETVIVDEAAQSVEVAALIPLRYDCRQCVLVGDPQQLPATVLSRAAVKSNYDQSLFRRLQRCGLPVHMLRTQYRSHPAISAFPSSYFYQSLVADAPSVKGPEYAPKMHTVPAFGPLLWWDLPGTTARGEGGVSYRNDAECRVVASVLRALDGRFPSHGHSVAVISPYREQVSALRAVLSNQPSDVASARTAEVGTVDGFQGREKDIVVLSLVRAGDISGVGFLDDLRRMNVALTRARLALWVVGDAKALSVSPHWAAFADHLRRIGALCPLSSPDTPLEPAAAAVRAACERAEADGAVHTHHARVRAGAIGATSRGTGASEDGEVEDDEDDDV